MERLSESISLFKVLDTHANLDSKRSLGECLSVHAWPRLGINLQILPNFQMEKCCSVEIWAGVSMVASEREHFASWFLLLTVTLTIADSVPPTPVLPSVSPPWQHQHLGPDHSLLLGLSVHRRMFHSIPSLTHEMPIDPLRSGDKHRCLQNAFGLGEKWRSHPSGRTPGLLCVQAPCSPPELGTTCLASLRAQHTVT